MRLRDQLRRQAQPPAPPVNREAHGVIEVGFLPARKQLKQIEEQLVNGPPAPEEGEIDPRTGAPMCKGRDVCDLPVCSAGIRAHGRASWPMAGDNIFPAGSTYAPVYYQGDGERITKQIQAGVEAVQAVAAQMRDAEGRTQQERQDVEAVKMRLDRLAEDAELQMMLNTPDDAA